MHRVLRHFIIPLTLVNWVFAASDGYNMPPAVTASMPVGDAMKKMETAVKPEVLEAFKQAHPATFWLFGEDRQLAVRNHIIPAHWFENGAKQFQQFSGVARPGEFYVFQVCMIPGEETRPLDCRVVFDALKEAEVTVLSGTPYGNARPGERRLRFGVDTFGKISNDPVKPIWIGLQIPETTPPGTYNGRIAFRESVFPSSIDPILQRRAKDPFDEQLAFAIKVEGEPIAESGTNEAWRLARLKWLDSKIGESDTMVPHPFSPVRVDRKQRTINILGRSITLGPNGIPSQLTSFFSESNTRILATGKNAFRAPPAFECRIDGKIVPLIPGEFEFTEQSPTRVSWRSVSTGNNLKLEVGGILEFDGNLRLSMNLSNTSGQDAHWVEGMLIDGVRLVVPWNKGVAKYAMGLGLKGGICPEKHDWKWDVKNHQDAIWMGDVNLGAMLRFKAENFRRPLINAYYDFLPLNPPGSWGSGGILIDNSPTGATLTAYSGPTKVTSVSKGSGGLHFDIDWYLTPFKPLDVKKHFTDRYYHIGQHAAAEDTAKLKAEGVNIIEIHHNRLCNPYINYPFNDDSFGRLKDFVSKAHGDDMRVNLYYTTRELTQNLPEFSALKSMGGEIILPRKEGVGWPVTNSQGPHPWLVEHAGRDIVPAWREELKFPEYPTKLDLAVITTPDSRWNNFYLEGLDYLVRKAGIDGLYIDDTALDRKSMQRARRILDADGNTGRRISMHSWNHHNGLAKWSNSSIAFMELYPYYDGLWHGEGFNANMPPEYMLVEMSGIPYGLMGEMLDHPNPWHGMVFGMRTRWPWSGDPRAMWKLEDLFGIADSEFTGWWDSACPVRSGQPQVKTSVFRKNGSTLIALASWASNPVKVKLDMDWKALGLDAAKVTLWAPACANFQVEKVFSITEEIPVAPGKGWVFIVDEKPREISASPADPFKNRKVLAEAPQALDIKVPANTVNTKDLPWAVGATAVAARIEPQTDAGQAWGVGLAVGWSDGKHIQVHARTDGRWGIRHNGSETLTGVHPRGAVATVAVRVAADTIRVMAREDSGDWEDLAEFPRAEYPGIPTAARYGKIGQGWDSGNFSDPGPTGNCRVDWVRMY